MTVEDEAYLVAELARVREQTLPFGFFRGWHVRDVPGNYLRWSLQAVPMSPGLRFAIESTLRRRAEHFWSTRREAALRRERDL